MEDVVVRRLQASDAALLTTLSLEDAAFDVEGREGEARSLSLENARSYLSNPAVLHWLAFDNDVIVGELQCVVIPLPDDRVQELVLYEVGGVARGGRVMRFLLALGVDAVRHAVRERSDTASCWQRRPRARTSTPCRRCRPRSRRHQPRH